MQALFAMLIARIQSKLLQIGNPALPTAYPTGSARSFISVDGAHSPTVSSLRMMDATYGTYVSLRYDNNAIGWFAE